MTPLQAVPEVETTETFDQSLAAINEHLGESAMELMICQLAQVDKISDLDVALLSKIKKAIAAFKKRLIDSATPDGLKVTGYIPVLVAGKIQEVLPRSDS